jgi:integrase
MGVYFIKNKGYRYEFVLKGKRHTKAWFKTKTAAKLAEAKRREELENPDPVQEEPTDMAFLDLVNIRLDYVKAYHSEEHYRSYLYLGRRWVKKWGELMCSEITPSMIQEHLLERRKISAYTANKDLRYFRATINFGLKKRYMSSDPAKGFDFFPVEKKVKYVPPTEDIDKVFAAATPDECDFLVVIRETMARVSEVNRLLWDDVDIKNRCVILYTRKKRGGHLTPRKIPMTRVLYDVLVKRNENRNPSKPWVFWHRYWSRKAGKFCEGPYGDRKKLMKRLCEKAGVRYFRFHPIRHYGASVMDLNNVPIGAIQRILGHENRKTTEIYLHSIGDVERNAISIYERAREKSHTVSHTGGIQRKQGPLKR